jgi:integrase
MINENLRNSIQIFKKRSSKNAGFIFLSNQNSIFSSQYLNREIKNYYGAKDLNISSHSLRKTFGRRVWENNKESEKALIYLSELYNHSNTAITRIYLGIRQEELDNIYLSL